MSPSSLRETTTIASWTLQVIKVAFLSIFDVFFSHDDDSFCSCLVLVENWHTELRVPEANHVCVLHVSVGMMSWDDESALKTKRSDNEGGITDQEKGQTFNRQSSWGKKTIMTTVQDMLSVIPSWQLCWQFCSSFSQALLFCVLQKRRIQWLLPWWPPSSPLSVSSFCFSIHSSSVCLSQSFLSGIAVSVWSQEKKLDSQKPEITAWNDTPSGLSWRLPWTSSALFMFFLSSWSTFSTSSYILSVIWVKEEEQSYKNLSSRLLNTRCLWRDDDGYVADSFRVYQRRRGVYIREQRRRRH